MNSNEEFPLDSFGIDPSQENSTPQSRQKQKLLNIIATVVAVDQSCPMCPSTGSLDIIHRKISHRSAMTVKQRLFVWSGWAAAAAVTLFIFIRPSSHPDDILTKNNAGTSTNSKPSLPYQSQDHSLLDSVNNNANHASRTENNNASTPHEKSRSIRDQQRSLIQKIETLRNEVALLKSRDTERLIAQNGVTWPIIMKLTSPGTDPAAAFVQNPILGAMLNQDSLTDASFEGENAKTAATTPDLTIPSAVPIYDPARDIGQLLVNNLSPQTEGQAYFLWVQSDNAPQPVLVGTLPDTIGNSEMFDFKLGSTGIIPDQFLITQDTALSPQIPNSSNTVLQGPNSNKE